MIIAVIYSVDKIKVILSTHYKINRM